MQTTLYVLNRIFKYEGKPFSFALHRHLLNRDPDSEELRGLVSRLSAGLSKDVVFKEIVESNEFEQLLTTANSPSTNIPGPTVAQNLHAIVQREDMDFVDAVCQEILGTDEHLKLRETLRAERMAGKSKTQVLKEVILSAEAAQLFSSPFPVRLQGASSQTAIPPESSIAGRLHREMSTDGRDFVVEMYRQLLSREPDVGGLDAHLGLLSSGQSKWAVVDSLLWSAEGQALLSGQGAVLAGGRLPRIARFASVTRRLRAVLRRDGTAFVRALYLNVLGRLPRKNELRSHQHLLASGVTKDSLLYSTLLSNELRRQLSAGGRRRRKRNAAPMTRLLRQLLQMNGRRFVRNTYRQVLGRAPDPAGLQTHLRMLRSKTPKTSVLYSILLSDEARVLLTGSLPPRAPSLESIAAALQGLLRQDGAGFVTELYRQVLGREPDGSGFQAHMSALAAGVSKLDLLRGMLASGEARGEDDTGVQQAIKERKNMPVLRIDEPGAAAIGAAVSVIIPTKDAGEGFAMLLSDLRSQRGIGPLDIVVVDSGSSDHTVDIAQLYQATLIQIPPHEYSHAHSRNLAAEHANGKYLLFVVQDMLPSSDTWISEMVSFLEENRLAAVSSLEIPREDADLFARFELHSYQEFLGVVSNQTRVLSKPLHDAYDDLRQNAQLSSVAMLISRATFQAYRFRSEYGEDLDLGLRLIRAGHRLGISAASPVIHSHLRSPYYFFKRAFVDSLALRSLFPDAPASASLLSDHVNDVLYAALASTSLAARLKGVQSLVQANEVKRIVWEEWAAFLEQHVYDSVPLNFDSFPDDRLRRVLGRLGEEFASTLSQGRENTLWFGLQNRLLATLDYLAEGISDLETAQLEEVAEALYKHLAVQAGGGFGHAYANAGAHNSGFPQWLYDELSRGV